jgi:hypothetical protein
MPDIPYQRNNRPRQYLSISKHQSTARNNSSKWININVEKQTFDTADYGNFTLSNGSIAWIDANGNLWGFLEGFPYIGTERQQFGYFQNPNNPVLEWHGFPIIPFSKDRYRISDQLLERWVNEGYLDQDDIPTLINKRRI